MPTDRILAELGGEDGAAGKYAAQTTLLEVMAQVRDALVTNTRNLQREVERLPFVLWGVGPRFASGFQSSLMSIWFYLTPLMLIVNGSPTFWFTVPPEGHFFHTEGSR